MIENKKHICKHKLHFVLLNYILFKNYLKNRLALLSIRIKLVTKIFLLNVNLFL